MKILHIISAIALVSSCRNVKEGYNSSFEKLGYVFVSCEVNVPVPETNLSGVKLHHLAENDKSFDIYKVFYEWDPTINVVTTLVYDSNGKILRIDYLSFSKEISKYSTNTYDRINIDLLNKAEYFIENQIEKIRLQDGRVFCIQENFPYDLVPSEIKRMDVSKLEVPDNLKLENYQIFEMYRRTGKIGYGLYRFQTVNQNSKLKRITYDFDKNMNLVKDVELIIKVIGYENIIEVDKLNIYFMYGSNEVLIGDRIYKYILEGE